MDTTVEQHNTTVLKRQLLTKLNEITAKQHGTHTVSCLNIRFFPQIKQTLLPVMVQNSTLLHHLHHFLPSETLTLSAYPHLFQCFVFVLFARSICPQIDSCVQCGRTQV